MPDELVQAEYFHIDAAMPGRSATEHNLPLDQVLEKIAVPLKLGRTVLIDGYSFPAGQITRLKIRRTSSRVEMETAMSALDLSSFGNALSSLLKVGAQLQTGEDVTSDVMVRAEQVIVEQGQTPEPASPALAPTDKNKVFVVSSFAPELDQNFEAISRACQRFGLTPVRVDKEMSSDAIVERIQRHLAEAAYVVADLTQARPNVYYEIGYFDALMFARQVRSHERLLLVAQNIERDAHFDLSHRGIEKYDNPFSLMTCIEEWLTRRGLSLSAG